MLNTPPEVSVVLIAFTAEERGLLGAKYYVNNPTVPLADVLGVSNMDMVSRGEKNLIFCEGQKSFPDLTTATEAANASIGLEIRFDEHPEWASQSDHYPFIQAGIPALYFGVEDHPDYHQVTDHADKIIPELTANVAKLQFQWIFEIAKMRADGRWTGDNDFPIVPSRSSEPVASGKHQCRIPAHEHARH